MKVFREINSLVKWLNEKRSSRTIGFVPTMGALHDGHLSLVRSSLQQHNLTVCSIFINPTQFNNAEDLRKYPSTIESDLRLLVQAGCNAVFYPDVNQMYPDGLHAGLADYGTVTTSLEGVRRPGHFDGVVAIVTKLFKVVQPNHAYFGQKDFQQCAVIAELIRRDGLSVELHICPTIREADGLAMSSRNSRLTPEERKTAVVIYETLQFLKANINKQPIPALINEAMKHIADASPVMQPEYVSIVDADTLEDITLYNPTRRSVALIAAWCGNVRLIDNMFLSE